MNCFRSRRSGRHTPSTAETPKTAIASSEQSLEARRIREVTLKISGCTVYLIDGGESVELAKGDFTIIRLLEENDFLAIIVQVGDDLQWPLTKDEPVVKLDALHYLFSLSMKDGSLLSYAVTFSDKSDRNLRMLDSFLKEHSCFSGPAPTQTRAVNWKEFAPKIEDYNGVLAKAVAGGTGEIIKGIFKCSNAYTNQVQKGGEMVQSRAMKEENGVSTGENKSNTSVGGTKKTGINKGLKRVRKLSKMTEKMSKSLLNGVGIASGSVMVPMVRSRAGKAFLAMVPGEVLLASLDAVNKILDAAEAAEKQALSATSSVVTGKITNRFGENAGEATEDVLATAGHCACIAWNIFKIRKFINPAASVPSAILKNAAKKRKP